MPQVAQPLKLDDFSGGINENHIQADINEYESADNLVLTNDRPFRKLIQRDGSVILDEDAGRPEEERIGTIFEFDGAIYVSVEGRLYRHSTAAWTELTGPDSNSALDPASRFTHISRTFWNKHLFLVSADGGKPQKIYKDETGTIRLRTAGLPPLANEENFVRGAKFDEMVTRAVAIKTALASHFTNTTVHNSADFASQALLPGSTPTTNATLFTYIGSVLRAYENHYQDFAQEKRDHHSSPLSEPAILSSAQLTTTVDPASLEEAQTALNDLFVKINQHSGDYDIHNNNKSDLIDPVANDLISGVNSGPLPNKSVQHIYDLANELKGQINAHFADTTIHNSAETDTITVADATTNETLMDLVEDIRLKYSQHIENGTVHDAADTTNQLTAHDSLKSSPAFTSDQHAGLGLGAFEATLTELVAVRTAYNAHDQESGASHNSAGTDYQVSSNVTASATYTYVFHYSFEYKVGTVTFLDQGPTLQKQVALTAPIGNYSVSITNIPILTNGVQDNYDTSTIKVNIYRTASGGDVFYKVGSVTNGTTTFTDSVNDTDLVLQSLLYTTGGVLDNDAPPTCKTMHILKDTALFGHITDTDGTVLSNRVRQSIAGDPDSAPASLFDDLEDSVVAISSAKNKFVVLCEENIYRTEGSFDATGRGFLRHEKIANVGCVSANSVIRTPGGVFFAGTDGFYFTDGFNALLLSSKIENTYLSLIQKENQQKKIYGAYDSINKRVWWAVQSQPTSSENDMCFIADIQAGVQNVAFTTASNSTHFKPSALYFRKDEMIRGDQRGYVFSHKPAYKSDPKVDTTTTPDNWTKATIIYDFKSATLDFGSIQQRKWGTRINFTGQDRSNLSLQIKNINDDNAVTSLKLIRYRGNLVWGDEDLTWGDATLKWSHGKRMIDEQRRNVAGSLRFNYKQIQLTNADAVVDNSDDKGTAGITQSTMRVTLDTATNKWPLHVVDYKFASETDSYVQTFPIKERVSNTIIRIEGKYVITSGSNDKLDYKETSADSERTLTLSPGTYTPDELAQHITHLFDDTERAASEAITCTYSDSTQSFTLATTESSAFELLPATGTNSATSVGALIGFSADQTGATSYTGSAARGNLPATAAAQQWQITGKPKDEKLHIQSLNIQWSPLTPGKSQSDYGGSSESGNLGE